MDFDKYLLIPYSDVGTSLDGCNCWGLVSLIYKNELGVILPSYDTNASNHEAVEKDILEAKTNEDSWLEISGNSLDEFFTQAKLFDIVLLRIQGVPWHIGVYLGEKKFIHTLPKIGPSVARLASISWRSRFLGAYRWKNLN